MTEPLSCPACQRGELVYQETRRSLLSGMTTDVYRCNHCGFVKIYEVDAPMIEKLESSDEMLIVGLYEGMNW